MGRIPSPNELADIRRGDSNEPVIVHVDEPSQKKLRVCVISSLYGDLDSVRIPERQILDWNKRPVECEFIMVTGKAIDQPPWRNIVEPRPSVPARLASRIAKCYPWLYTDADITIWVDANIQITSPDFVRWCVESLGDNLLCQWIQSEADIHRELNVSRAFRKWDKDKDSIQQQVDHYLASGYPEKRNTFWCGIIVRSKKAKTILLGKEWLEEIVRWTCQDQIAYAFVTHKLGLEPALLPMMDYESVDEPALHWKYEHYIRWFHSEDE